MRLLLVAYLAGGIANALSDSSLNIEDGQLKQSLPGVIGAKLHKVNKRFSDSRIQRINANIFESFFGSKKDAAASSTPVSSIATDSVAMSYKDALRNIPGDKATAVSIAAPESVSQASDNSRSPTVAEPALNRLTYYMMNITLGTPPQDFMVQIDTGSSDLWIPSNLIQFDGFNPGQSSSFHRLGESFDIQYVKDSATGDWVLDTFGLGSSDVSIKNFQFAVANSAPGATAGILGIGLVDAETASAPYPNLPILLAKNGYINRATYSMYMGGMNDVGGQVLFGGVDRAKFDKLARLQILPGKTIQVALDNITIEASRTADPKLAPSSSAAASTQTATTGNSPQNGIIRGRSESEIYFNSFDASNGPLVGYDQAYKDDPSRWQYQPVNPYPDPYSQILPDHGHNPYYYPPAYVPLYQPSEYQSNENEDSRKHSSSLSDWYSAIRSHGRLHSLDVHKVQDTHHMALEEHRNVAGTSLREKLDTAMRPGIISSNSPDFRSNGQSSSSNTSIPVLLDTGTSLAYLPPDIVKGIASQFNAKYETELDMYVVHARDLQNVEHKGINFVFNGLSVTMPKAEMFWPLSWFTSQESPYYVMTLLPNDASMGFNILGDSFLRNAYVVYDLDKREVLIGPYKPSETSDIVAY